MNVPNATILSVSAKMSKENKAGATWFNTVLSNTIKLIQMCPNVFFGTAVDESRSTGHTVVIPPHTSPESSSKHSLSSHSQ